MVLGYNLEFYFNNTSSPCEAYSEVLYKSQNHKIYDPFPLEVYILTEEMNKKLWKINAVWIVAINYYGVEGGSCSLWAE